MTPRIQLGLTTALLVLAACSTRTVDEAGDETGDGDGETNAKASESGDDTTSTETGEVEPMCAIENYADDPQLGEFVARGCVGLVAGGTCAPCSTACMEDILSSCESCFEPEVPEEDPVCFDECTEHRVLCSEEINGQCCHLVTADYGGSVPGRPLREAGEVRLPELACSGAQSEAGRRYREFARYERASVDAFAFAAALLDELGAPQDLVEAHRVAAREEAEHAQLALACAESLDGCTATLGELDVGEWVFDVERFVCDLIHDGCIGELVAAHEAAFALAQADVREREVLRHYWQTVLDEETGHAQLAWRTLEWLLAARPELAAITERELTRAMAISGDDLRERAIAALHASARAAA